MTHFLFASSHAGVDLLPVGQTFHLKSPPDGKVFPAATPSSGKVARSRVPSHLYRKGQIYYFRFVLPRVMQKELGGVEIRLSLRTAYLREAKILADRLYLAMTAELQKTPPLPLPEIKKRLAILVAKLAEQQAATLEAVEDERPYTDGERLTAQELRDEQKAIYQSKTLQAQVYEGWIADKCYLPLTDSVDEARLKELLPFLPRNSSPCMRSGMPGFLFVTGTSRKRKLTATGRLSGTCVSRRTTRTPPVSSTASSWIKFLRNTLPVKAPSGRPCKPVWNM